ncbi:hypothetical protein OSB04_016369 [Centaurea solstitialis]|uniref:Uncharacterized protein n=1 Tax=Centaurea solstitialis TaxID=347529 RepID=A0AA38T2F9_9ASTR|nr:hypothetical protein OSB04_016369 [Centaurea solstitialis]
MVVFRPRNRQNETETPDLRGLIASELGIRGTGSSSQRQPRGCSYKDFSACWPPLFKEKKDPVASTRWIAEVRSQPSPRSREGLVGFDCLSPYRRRSGSNDMGPIQGAVPRAAKKRKQEQPQMSSKKQKQVGHKPEGIRDFPKCRYFKSQCPKLTDAIVQAPAPTTLRISDGSSGSKDGATASRGRAFQLTAEEAKVAPDMVLGASRYFVSHTFFKGLDHTLGKLDRPLAIESAYDKIMDVANVFRQ